MSNYLEKFDEQQRQRKDEQQRQYKNEHKKARERISQVTVSPQAAKDLWLEGIPPEERERHIWDLAGWSEVKVTREDEKTIKEMYVAAIEQLAQQYDPSVDPTLLQRLKKDIKDGLDNFHNVFIDEDSDEDGGAQDQDGSTDHEADEAQDQDGLTAGKSKNQAVQVNENRFWPFSEEEHFEMMAEGHKKDAELEQEVGEE